MITLQVVKLHEGPHDGKFSVASHSTAISCGELYVWDGDPDTTHFVYAKSLLKRLTPVERAELTSLNEWLNKIHEQPAGTSVVHPPARVWLVNLAVAIRQHGDFESEDIPHAQD